MNSESIGLGPAISFITLGVTDLAKSRIFYESMGLEAHPRSNSYVVFFDVGGQVFALFPRESLAEDAGSVPGSTETTITMSLAQNVASEADVGRLLQRAVNAGGTLLREPSAPPWGGIRGYFADPDGFAWEVAWNPGIAIGADGRVAIRNET
jgi:predicted lactoylglutathione lyase